MLIYKYMSKNINKILRDRFDEEQQLLKLKQCHQYWSDILTQYQWNQLQKLNLINCGISSKISILLAKPWANLTHIWLNMNNIGCRGIKILTKAQINCLEVLYLTSCSIGDEGLKFLVKGKWEHLQQLFINNNFIQFYGYSNLYLANWKQLRYLWMSEIQSEEQNSIIQLQLTAISSNKCSFQMKVANSVMSRRIKFIQNQRTSL